MLAVSSQILAKEDIVERASFKADHNFGVCCHQPGALSMQPDVLIRLLLVIT